MIRKLLKSSASGFLFIGASYAAVNFMGFNWISFSLICYLFVLNSVLIALASEIGALGGGLRGMLDRLVVVAEGEELRLKRIVSGEKYKVKGELEKL